MAKSSLRLTFILPFVSLTGGIKIIFEHANRLAERGHNVTLVYPGILFHGGPFNTTNTSFRWRYVDAPLRQLKYWLFVTLLHKTDASWFPLDRRVTLKRTPDLSAHYIPEADIVVAVSPDTAEWVHTYPAQKGRQVFFSQDYDVWAWPVEKVDRVYTYPMGLVTIGSWQKKLYKDKFNREVDAVVPDGVDTHRFNARGKKLHEMGKPWRVLMVYHHLAYKRIDAGLAAIEKARQAGYDIKLVLFGVHPLKENIPADTEYHRDVPEDGLPDIYRSCDIFLWPTEREGFGLPPMEAMACGVPVVGTDAGAMPDFMEEGGTGYMVSANQPELLGDKLIEILAHEKQYEEMSQRSAEVMKAWDWERQTDKLEEYLTKLNQGK